MVRDLILCSFDASMLRCFDGSLVRGLGTLDESRNPKQYRKVVDMLAGQIALVLLCKAIIYTMAYEMIFRKD